jgi:hypothetical protein
MNYSSTQPNGSARDEALKRRSAAVREALGMDPEQNPCAENFGTHPRACKGLIDESLNAHLVVATVRSKTALQAGKQLLARLLEALKPEGHYALGELQDGNHFAVRCLFEREEDAVKLGMAARATQGSRYSGFATQRAFLLDHRTYKGIQTVTAELGRVTSSGRKGDRLAAQ